MKELWKDIDGYGGRYRISNTGKVMSMTFGPKNYRSIYTEPKLLKLTQSSTGYLHVQLYKNGKSSTKLVHILVASAFVENPSNYPEINHIDGNKLNNSASNLEWVTKSENIKHAFRKGLHVPPLKGVTGSKNPLSRPVLQYDLEGNFITKWAGRSEAARHFGVDKQYITHCVTGKHKTALGFIWIDYNGGDMPTKIDPQSHKPRS